LLGIVVPTEQDSGKAGGWPGAFDECVMHDTLFSSAR
jgi:hypothetical protein